MLWVEEGSLERNTAANKKVFPNLSKHEHKHRLRLGQILAAYEFLDIATPRVWNHDEIYRSCKDPERKYIQSNLFGQRKSNIPSLVLLRSK